MTDLNISDSSIGTENGSYGQYGGHLLSFLCEDINKIVLEAFKEGEFNVASYLILKNKVTDYTVCDDEGFTILHYLVTFYEKIPKSDEVIDLILKQKHCKEFINNKDKKFGNTPLHLAVKKGNYELSNKLLTCGANANIENNEGMIINHFKKTTNLHRSDSDKIINKNYIKKNNLDEYSSVFKGIDYNNNLNNNLNNNSNFSNGLYESGDKDYSDLIDELINNEEKVNLTGGSKKTRKMLVYSDSEYSVNTKFDNLDLSKLSRSLERQSNIIHERTIKKIMEIMGVDEDTAKIYKAGIYQRVKNEHPDLPNLDRANEMEKLATRDNLEKIDVKKLAKEIAKHREERSAESPKEEKKDKKDKKEKKDNKDKKEKKEKKDKKEKKTSRSKKN